MDINKAFKIAMLNKGIKQIDLAAKFGKSKSAFNQVFSKPDFRISQLVEIAGAIGYDVKIQLVDKDTGKVINIE
jgi:transcriptional regulator with XRE-family HTH domain